MGLNAYLEIKFLNKPSNSLNRIKHMMPYVLFMKFKFRKGSVLTPGSSGVS